MALGTGLENFSKEYPERFFDVGIAEEHAVTFASGLSAGGMIPVFAVYSTFLQRCFDQLVHDCALQRQKAVIAVDRAGFVGEDGETHQGLYDLSFFKLIPNIVIMAPRNFKELEKMMNETETKTATVDLPYPSFFLQKYGEKPDTCIENGKITYTLDGRELACTYLKANETVSEKPQPNFFARLISAIFNRD